MPSASSRTLEFRQALTQHPKYHKPSSPPLPPTSSSPHSLIWITEANRLASTINNLSRFLTHIRPPYLNHPTTHSTPKSPSLPPPSSLLNPNSSSSSLDAFLNIQALSENDKDELEILIGVALRKCLDGLRALEAAEKARQKSQQDQSSTPLPISKIIGITSLFLSSSNKLNPNSEDQMLNLHRDSIVWFLNQKLSEVTHLVKELQEERVLRKMMRSSFGSGSSLGSWKGKGTSSGGVLSVHNSSNYHQKNQSPYDISRYKPKPYTLSHSNDNHQNDDEDHQPIESLLSSTQLEQFESESSLLLKESQSTLSSIKKTESALLEISSLQSQLVNHLTEQTELIDKLWEDSMVSSEKVEQGNVLLRKAKEDRKESRIWMVVFLVGAAFGLLFVEFVAP